MSKSGQHTEVRIKIVCGPMKSGKSRVLFMDIDRLKHRNMPMLVFKPSIDTRVGGAVFTRYIQQTLDAIAIKDSKEILQYLEKENMSPPLYILIDEVQFFDSDIVDVVKYLAQQGYCLYLYGLDADAKWNTFGPVGDLLVAADTVVKLNSVCEDCQGIATKTALVSANNSFKKNAVIIDDGGAEDMFRVSCDDCFFKDNVSGNSWSRFDQIKKPE